MLSSPTIIRLQDQPATQPRLVDASAVLGALPAAILVIDRNNRLSYANAAAEQFFRTGASVLIGQSVFDIAPSDRALNVLIEQCRRDNASLAEHGVTLELPRIGRRKVSIAMAPIAESPDAIVVSLEERSITDQIDRQMTHRDAARSVGAMAAVLAHEIKNPLSGIRGAAQLLENGASAENRELTGLICEEADRIVALVDRMETFADARPIERKPVNIHQVLEHVRRIAENGFGRGRRYVEEYDPSLPLVYGNRDLLVQMFLNLMKNACEATVEHEGMVTLSTRYQHGVRVAVPGSKERLLLPLLVSIADNGPGIPAEVQSRLFDPFVTTKQGGKGLGLAMVAKIVGDHDGTIEFSTQPRRTAFLVRLPAAMPDAAGP